MKSNPRPTMLENRGRFVVPELLEGSWSGQGQARMSKSAVIDCGWGRIIFGQSFDSSLEIVGVMQSEPPGRRDVALYVRDSRGILEAAPKTLFLDPSYSYRLDLRFPAEREVLPPRVIIRPAMSWHEAAVNQLYLACDVVPVRKGYCCDLHNEPAVTLLVAQEPDAQGSIIGVAMGVDHRDAFNDPNNGSSLWALAVAPQTHGSSVRKALVTAMARRFRDAGRSFMDLSVSRDDRDAIALCEELGFLRTPVRAIRRKQPEAAAVV